MPPHLHRDGDRLLLPQRPDLRATAGWLSRAGGLLAIGGGGLAALAASPAVGAGAVGLVLGLVGIITLGIAGFIRWIVRRVVVVDLGRGQILGRGEPVALDTVLAFRLREYTHRTEYGANRRIALEVVVGPGPCLDSRQEPVDPGVLAPPHPALDLVDAADEAALREAALAVSRATHRPVLDFTATPAQMLWGDGRRDAARGGERAATARGPVSGDLAGHVSPGPAPPGLTVHSLRPLHVAWRGARLAAVWPLLGGFFLSPFGVGFALHRAELDALGILCVGVPAALMGWALLTRKGPCALQITADTVIYQAAGLPPLSLPRHRVVGVVRSAAGSAPTCQLRLDDGNGFGQLPAEPAASAWLEAAVAWALGAREG